MTMFLSIILSLAGLNSGLQDETPGVTIRIWDIGDSMMDVHPIEPGQLPNTVVVMPTLDLNGNDFHGHQDYFVLRADGSLVLAQPGVYEFKLISDDGSELWIAGNQVIDHGGLHSATAKTGRMALEAGTHPFQVKYFENTADAALKLEWKPPLASAFTVIPENNLRTRLDPDMPRSPGRKAVVRPKLDRHPGHGSPLMGLHPRMSSKQHPLPNLDGAVTGMGWLDDGKMVLITDAGTLWAVGSQWSTQKGSLWAMAEGLDDPGGLLVDGDDIWVIQREELTRLRDTDEDGRVDEFDAVSTGWPVAGDDAGQARGLLAQGEDFLVLLGRARDAEGRPIGSEHRGTVLRISRDGSWDIIAEGLIEPEGFVQGMPDGIAYLDQAAAGGVAYLGGRQDAPHQSAVHLPEQGTSSSPSSAIMLSEGPWQGHLLVSDSGHGGLKRVQFDAHESGVQGCVFRATQGIGTQVDHVGVDPEGVIWAIVHDANGSFMCEVDLGLAPVLEIERVKAFSNGLEVIFSESFDPAVAAEASSWHLRASDLHNPDEPSSVLQVDRVILLPGGRRAFLEVSDLPSHSHLHLQLVGPWSGDSSDILHSNECWYTMRTVPSRIFAESANTIQPGHNMLTAREKSEGWKLLFDGESADHWRGFRKQDLPAGWSVIDGAIVRTGSGGDIITREQFDDFELMLDWKVQPGGNSGIFYNVTEDGGAVYSTGPEMQVLDNKGHADGGSPLTSAGANYALHPPAWDTTGPPGTWNRARIVMDGDRVEHWLNGVLLLEYVLNSPDWERRVADSKFSGMPDYGRRTSGHIALQDHGDVVAFRNLKIRRLDSPSAASGAVE